MLVLIIYKELSFILKSSRITHNICIFSHAFCCLHFCISSFPPPPAESTACLPPCGCALLFPCCGWGQEDARRRPTHQTWSNTRLQTSMKSCTLGRWCLSISSIKVSPLRLELCGFIFEIVGDSFSLCLQSLQPSLSSWWSWRSLPTLCRITGYWLAR